jgi:predicted flap endonuclease-1-like 5' DNA nuclease
MVSTKKSGIRWWMWISAILGAAAAFLFVTILKRRRQAKGQVVAARRIELRPKPRPRPGKKQQPAEPKPTGSKAVKRTTTKSKAARPAKPDDLKVIEGIGPKTAGVLQSSGVKTYAQLSLASVDQIRVVLTENRIRANPSTWPEQAKLAASSKWEALEALQAKLKGGRRV